MSNYKLQFKNENNFKQNMVEYSNTIPTIKRCISIVIVLVLLFLGLIASNKSKTIDPLTPKEREWLTKHVGKIRIADAPVGGLVIHVEIDKYGKKILRGMSADYIELLEKKLKFKFKRVYPKTWAHLIEMARNKETDVIGSIQKTGERIKYLNFTEPYLKLTNVIVVRKIVEDELTLDMLKGRKIAVVNKFSVTEYLKANHPYLNLDDENKDDYVVLKKVSSGEVYAGVCDIASVSYRIDKRGISNLRIAGEIDYVMELSIATRKDWPVLNQILEKGLALITAQERKAIWKRWITIDSSRFILPWYIFAAAGAILLISITTLVWNRTLKRKVEERTKALNNELSKRKQIERELRKSENKFRQIFENAAEGIFQTYLDGRFKTVNPAFASIFGYGSVEEAINDLQNVRNIYKDPSKRDEVLRLIEKHKRIIDFEIEGYNKDDKIVNILLNARIVEEDEQETYLEGSIIDITEKKEKEKFKIEKEAAERANNAKSLFIANMSHEIRTPMHSILGYTELLENQVEGEKPKRYLSVIESSGKTLLSLINEILDLSKIESGKIDLDLQPVNLFNTLNQIQQIFSGRINEKKLDFYLDINPSLPKWLMFVEIRLKEILFNLVGNAVKFTEFGYVKLEVEWDQESEDKSEISVVITIEDTGIGISREQQAKIFEPFVQQAPDISDKYGGTGLGLTIARRLVEIMGGEIILKSEPGKGSTFKVKFKNIHVASLSSNGKAEDLINPDNILFSEKTILIVDDKKENRMLLKDFLENYGLNILEAQSGETAVELTRKHVPDLVLMDMKMPGMDGYEATRIIKADDKLKHIPVIAITASVMKMHEHKVTEAGCDGLLRKPVNRVDLIKELARFIPYKEKLTTVPSTEVPVINEKSLADRIPALENINKLPELLNIMENKLMNNWQKLNKRLILRDVETFAKDMITLGKEFSMNMLSEWGEALYNKKKNFDIKGISRMVDEFPVILKTIKEIIKKGEDNESKSIE